MATTSTKSGKDNEARSPEDLAADIEQLKADIAKLTELLQETGQHSYGAARRAAAEGDSRFEVAVSARRRDISGADEEADAAKPA